MKVNLRLNFWLTFVNEQERNEFISHFEKQKQEQMITSSMMAILLLEIFSFRILEIHYRKTENFINIQSI